MEKHTDRTSALIDKLGAQMKAEAESRQDRERILELASKQDPYDQRLRNIIARHTPPQTAHGMAGAAQVFDNYLSPAWYKMKAAEKLLRVRTLRRWHAEFKGKPYTSKSFVADAGFCRRRAAGLEPMPPVKAILL